MEGSTINWEMPDGRGMDSIDRATGKQLPVPKGGHFWTVPFGALTVAPQKERLRGIESAFLLQLTDSLRPNCNKVDKHVYTCYVTVKTPVNLDKLQTELMEMKHKVTIVNGHHNYEARRELGYSDDRECLVDLYINLKPVEAKALAFMKQSHDLNVSAISGLMFVKEIRDICERKFGSIKNPLEQRFVSRTKKNQSEGRLLVQNEFKKTFPHLLLTENDEKNFTSVVQFSLFPKKYEDRFYAVMNRLVNLPTKKGTATMMDKHGLNISVKLCISSLKDLVESRMTAYRKSTPPGQRVHKSWELDWLLLLDDLSNVKTSLKDIPSFKERFAAFLGGKKSTLTKDQEDFEEGDFSGDENDGGSDGSWSGGQLEEKPEIIDLEEEQSVDGSDVQPDSALVDDEILMNNTALPATESMETESERQASQGLPVCGQPVDEHLASTAAGQKRKTSQQDAARDGANQTTNNSPVRKRRKTYSSHGRRVGRNQKGRPSVSPVKLKSYSPVKMSMKSIPYENFKATFKEGNVFVVFAKKDVILFEGTKFLDGKVSGWTYGQLEQKQFIYPMEDENTFDWHCLMLLSDAVYTMDKEHLCITFENQDLKSCFASMKNIGFIPPSMMECCKCIGDGEPVCTVDSQCTNVAMNQLCHKDNCGAGYYCKNRSFEKPECTGFEVRMTTDKGEGLFATVSIGKDVYLGEYTGERITSKKRVEQIKSTSVVEGKFYLIDIGENVFIDGKSASSGLLSKINHDCVPNCRAERWKDLDGQTRIKMFSSKRISIGQEILWDYGCAGGSPFPCRSDCRKCGSSKRGNR